MNICIELIFIYFLNLKIIYININKFNLKIYIYINYLYINIPLYRNLAKLSFLAQFWISITFWTISGLTTFRLILC